MQWFYRMLADIVLVLHVFVVAFNVGALPVIWLSHLRGWRLARDPFFRIFHLALVAFVTVETAFDAVCPLTSLEEAFRLKAGSRTVVREGFVSHWLHQVLYWDVSWHTLLAMYVLFLGLVVLTFFYIKPRRPSPCVGSGLTQRNFTSTDGAARDLGRGRGVRKAAAGCDRSHLEGLPTNLSKTDNCHRGDGAGGATLSALE